MFLLEPLVGNLRAIEKKVKTPPEDPHEFLINMKNFFFFNENGTKTGTLVAAVFLSDH